MSTWRTCSSCKRPIQHGQTYWVCAVSTCNRPATSFVFCKPACWDAHLSVMNHRSAWCEEKHAPPEVPPQAEPVQRRIIRAEPKAQETDVLIVASRLKEYVERRAGMNTSAEVLQALSDIVRFETDRAIERAREDGRKTVKGRDFTQR